MRKDLVDVLATDLAVSALAERRPVDSDDSALHLLQVWAADLDGHPITVDAGFAESASARRRPRGAARTVVAMTLALTLSSTGIAAAVQGNPFGPIHFVVDKFGHLGNHDRSSPVDMIGGHKTPPADLRDREERARAEHNDRPSRSRPADQTDGAESQEPSSAPIVANRSAPLSHNGQNHKPRAHHRPLVVQRPNGGPVDDPRPQGGETPPNRPEPPAIPSIPSWPRPAANEPSPPPDEPAITPMPEGPETAPVR
jgi:hypothetical protein